MLVVSVRKNKLLIVDSVLQYELWFTSYLHLMLIICISQSTVEISLYNSKDYLLVWSRNKIGV